MSSAPLFADRADAGRRLLRRVLVQLDTEPQLVIGLSGGGVEIGGEVARALKCPLAIAVIESGGSTTRRVEATQRMRATIGETGFLNTGGTKAASDRARQDADRGELTARHGARHGLPDVQGKRVLLVDDGLHPDTQVNTALQELRLAGASHIVLAVPFLTRSSADLHGSECDDIVAIDILDEYGAATQFYTDPSPPSPDDVRGLLAELGEAASPQA